MSTARKLPASSALPAKLEDLFRYGTREVVNVDEHGRLQLIPVPLTLEDWLHPQLGDHLTQNQAHYIDCYYLVSTFRMLLHGRRGAVVLGDQNIYWDRPELRHHCPDAAVVLNVPQPRPSYESFHVVRDGAIPVLIVEVTSPATRQEDLHTKRRAYWQAGVPQYVIVDELPRRRRRTLRIIAYQRGRRGYQRVPLNAQGRVWLPAAAVWLGQEGGRVVCYDAQCQLILGRTEVEEVRLQAEQRAAQEAAARQTAEQRARDEAAARQAAEAEVARLRALLRQHEEE
jgi:Uma2 family endonuclease